MPRPLRVGFVTGATPDKWATTWRQRHPREPLELVPVDEATQEVGLRSGDLDLCLVRLPVVREGLHCIPLYDELPVAVVPAEHPAAAMDDLAVADLAGEQLVLPHRSGWQPDAVQLDWPAMTVRDALEVVASGGGIAIVPMSVARLHHRRDTAWQVVHDLPATTVALAWRIQDENPQLPAFVGIVRGRTERSSRS